MELRAQENGAVEKTEMCKISFADRKTAVARAGAKATSFAISF
jgi:hypothetical protein